MNERDRRVLDLAPMVRAVARGFAGTGVPHEDLVQVGMVGAIVAVDAYDPARGVPLVAYARLHVNGAIGRYVRRERSLVSTRHDDPRARRIRRDRSLDAALAEGTTRTLHDRLHAHAATPEDIAIARVDAARAAAVLNDADRELLARRAAGAKLHDLAPRFGVTASALLYREQKALARVQAQGEAA